MRRILFTLFLLLAVAAMSLSMPGAVLAGDAMSGMGGKLSRGIVNAATGWVELPKGIHDEAKERDPLTGLIFGSVKGAGHTVVRTGAGGYEAGTFLFPVPKDYEPVMEPETLLKK